MDPTCLPTPARNAIQNPRYASIIRSWPLHTGPSSKIKRMQIESVRTPYLGIAIDDWSLDETVSHIENTYASKFVGVVTPNVDHVVRLNSQTEDGLAQAYACATVILNDSQVVKYLSSLLRLGVKNTVRGSDLVPALLKKCNDKNVLLVGPNQTVTTELLAAFPIKNIDVHTPPMGVEVDDQHYNALVSAASDDSYDLVLICLGCPVSENALERVSKVRKRGTVICCGASIDFLTGSQKRAPYSMQKLGLEWCYRAISDPRRLGRRYVMNAVGLFRLVTVRLLSGKLRSQDLW